MATASVWQRPPTLEADVAIVGGGVIGAATAWALRQLEPDLRVAIVDVAELGLFYRMLAFLTLGVCLLAVSFLYAKYADDLQRWL